MANALGYNGGRFYGALTRPVLIDCNFIVDPANGNGLGIRSLKGSMVKNVFMHTTASFSGTTHTSTLVDGIASGTASLSVGMAVSGSGIAAGTKIAAILSSGSISLSIAAIASATVTISYRGINGGVVNPNPAVGFAVIQLKENYGLYAGGFSGFSSPLSGSNLAINSTALTVGQPYVIVSPGYGAAGAVTIAPVADSSGSLASTWFSIYDSYGNTYIIWFSVGGVGAAPIGVSGTLVQQTIAANATAAQIGTALVTTLGGLLAAQPRNLAAPSGVYSFTATGTTTVTVTNTLNVPFPGSPMDGLIPTGFTFAQTVFTTNQQDWAAVGLPAGVVPTVGGAFVATATGYSTGGGSTGLVQLPLVSGCGAIEVVGDPNQAIAPIPMGGSPNKGALIIVQFLAPTSSSVTTVIPTAPATNSVCGMSFYMDQSSINISGD